MILCKGGRVEKCEPAKAGAEVIDLAFHESSLPVIVFFIPELDEQISGKLFENYFMLRVEMILLIARHAFADEPFARLFARGTAGERFERGAPQNVVEEMIRCPQL